MRFFIHLTRCDEIFSDKNVETVEQNIVCTTSTSVMSMHVAAELSMLAVMDFRGPSSNLFSLAWRRMGWRLCLGALGMETLK